MLHIQSNPLPLKYKHPGPPPFFNHKPPPMSFRSSYTYKNMQYTTSTTTTTTTKFTENMAAAAPLAIGTRGTVGSLVRKEIEYFTKLELDRNGSSRKPRGQVVDMGSCSRSNSRSSFWFLTMTWKRKKPRVSRGFLPRICSVSEVSETNRLNGISGFNYMILKDDVKHFDV